MGIVRGAATDVSRPHAGDILSDVKHLVDLDDDLLDDARSVLGTSTIKETVNTALRLAAAQRRRDLNRAVDELAELVTSMPIADRAEAW